MKKQILVLALAATASAGASAQAVLGYSVTKSDGTYTPLSNPTVVYDAAAQQTPLTEDFNKTVWAPAGIQTGSTAQGYELGFTANIAGTEYSNFLISGAGYVYLGNGEVNLNTMMRANIMSYTGDYNVAGASCQRDSRGTSTTRVSYQVTGEGDAATLTVQYENIGQMHSFWGDPAVIDMQVSINAAGTVKVVYSNLANVGADNRLFMYMGVRQGEASVCAFDDNGTLRLSRNEGQTYPVESTMPNGTTFTFNPPTDCTMPSAAPTELTLSATSADISGTFAQVADADTYLVVYNAGEAIAFEPVDGTTYNVGHDFGSDLKVACFGSKNEFQISGLESSTRYAVQVFAANSFGLNGPVYNRTAAAASVTTMPAAPAVVTVGESTLNSITLNITPNAANDDVVVVYNSYCDRDNYGDHGLFGQLGAATAQGDVLPVPEGYQPLFAYEGAPVPANAGTVAFVGKADAPVVISGLEPSTEYYVAVYSRNADGVYSSDVIYDGASTLITCPYDGDMFNSPRFRLPFGWSTAEATQTTYAFRNESYYMRGALSQGTQPIQQTAKLNRVNPSTGVETWMTLAPVAVQTPLVQLDMNYCINQAEGRFASGPYVWQENDQLAIRVSTDNGTSWTVAGEYNLANHPAQNDKLEYSTLTADLTPYAGQTVLVQVYFKSYSAAAWGVTVTVDRFSLKQLENTAVPSNLAVSQITESSAVVSWNGAQNAYKVVYGKTGSEQMTELTVEGTTACTLDSLEANTAYEVKVCGVLSEGFTEFTAPVSFTTADYPAVEAPENLTATVSNDSGTDVTFSWDPAVDALSYELAYRKSSETSWTVVTTTDTGLVLNGLDVQTGYKCKVRAYCTHDRVTPYSAQVSFVTGGTGIAEIDADSAAGAEFYDLTGRRVVKPSAGVYIMRQGDRTVKVTVK